MNIGLFFVGAGRDQIALQRQATRESAANELEREITRRAVSSQELIDNNVSIEQREGKWIHTIPAKIRFSGDNAPIDVVIDKTSSNNGVYSVTREKVGDIRFSYADGKYVVSFSDRVSQPTFTENITPQADVTRKQDVSEVKKLRTTELYKEKSNKSIPQILYDVV